MDIFLRTPYNYDRDAVSDETGLFCEDPSLAQQSSKDECDINEIVRRFNLSGQLPQGVSVPQYGDFSEVSDYHTALNMVRAADLAFMALPAHIRARFANDAGAFVDFCSDPANLEEMRSLGLAPLADAGGPTKSGGASSGGTPSGVDGGAAPHADPNV